MSSSRRRSRQQQDALRAVRSRATCDHEPVPKTQRYLGAMRVVDDAAEVARASDWVIAATHGWAVIQSLVPDVFVGYARIFHPAMREADERDLPLRTPLESRTGVPVQTGEYGVPWREVRWCEVAQANGKVAHPAMEWTAITGSYEYSWHGMQPGLWEQVPERGSLPLRLTRRLCEILAQFTTTAERCWCAIWEGYGDLCGLAFDERLPRLAMKHRPMLLTSGALSAVPEESFSDLFIDPDTRSIQEYRSPSLWWPEDRAWCVASDVDLQTTYLGASAACIDRLLHDDQLEVMPVTADQSVTLDADTINPTPAGDRTNA